MCLMYLGTCNCCNFKRTLYGTTMLLQKYYQVFISCILIILLEKTKAREIRISEKLWSTLQAFNKHLFNTTDRGKLQ